MYDKNYIEKLKLIHEGYFDDVETTLIAKFILEDLVQYNPHQDYIYHNKPMYTLTDKGLKLIKKNK